MKSLYHIVINFNNIFKKPLELLSIGFFLIILLFIIKIIDYLVMKLTESEVKELVKAALREAFINEGFMIKEKR